MGKIFLLTVLCAVTVGVFAQDVVPCMRTQQECRTSTSGRMIINNWLCCPAGYSMTFNGDCSCRKTTEVRKCDVGVQACRGAASTTSNVNGVLRCCQLGYSMQSINLFSVNGQAVESCTCSRSTSNGIVGKNIIIDGNTMVVNGSYGHFNSTEFQQHMATFGQRMREWGQRFQANMQTMGDRLRQSLSWLG